MAKPAQLRRTGGTHERRRTNERLAPACRARWCKPPSWSACCYSGFSPRQFLGRQPHPAAEPGRCLASACRRRRHRRIRSAIFASRSANSPLLSRSRWRWASRSAISISRSRYLIRVFEPLCSPAIYAIPIILFLPLYVLISGLGPASKIALGATISFFPIVMNTVVGFGSVDRTLVAAARSMGANNIQMFRHVLLPAALPVILAGLRMGFHRRAAVGHRQRDHRLVRRPRPSHRRSRRKHGYGADVRLHRFRHCDRGISQRRGVEDRRTGTMAVTSARLHVRAAGPAAAGFRRWLMRHPGVARLGIVILLLDHLGDLGALLSRSRLHQPAFESADVARRACSVRPACRRRCG